MDIFLFITLISISALFAAGETAFISLSPAKVRSIGEGGTKVGQIIYKLKTFPQRLLITILIGNNLVNISASMITANFTIRVFGSQALGGATAILTFTILLFGEILPKSFAQKHAVFICRLLAYPFLFLEIIFHPLVIIFEKIINCFIGLRGNKKSPLVTEEEFLAMVKIGQEEGVIKDHEQKFIANILEFSNTPAKDVMTPRKQVKALEGNTTLDAAIHYLLQVKHSRIPVFDADLDNIIGILTLANAARIRQHQSGKTLLKNLELLKTIFISESKPIQTLFNYFKKKRVHLALVLNDYGTVVGLVTIEDLLEAIVGDIEGEKDIDEIFIKAVDDKTFLVEGHTPIYLVNEKVGPHFNGHVPEHKPISSYILHLLKRLPLPGEKIDHALLTMIVEKMANKRIEKIKIIKKER